MRLRRLLPTLMLFFMGISAAAAYFIIFRSPSQHVGKETQPSLAAHKVAFILSNDIPSLRTFIDAVAKNCSDQGLNLEIKTFYHHQSTSLLQGQIDEALMAENKVLISIGAMAAQGIHNHLQKRKSKTPHVFACIAAPTALGISKGKHFTQNNSTGVAEDPAGALATFTDALVRLKPTMKKILVFHSNSPSLAEKTAELRSILSTKGIQTESVIASTTAEVRNFAHTKISPAIDAVLLLRDSLMLSNLQEIVKRCRIEHVPCVTSDIQSAVEGAVAAICVEETELIRLTVRALVKILRDKIPARRIPIAYFNSADLYAVYVNRQEIVSQGLNPQNLDRLLVLGEPPLKFVG